MSSEQLDKIQKLKEDAVEEMAKALIEEFKKDPEESTHFIKYLSEESLVNTTTQGAIEKIIADENQEQMKGLLSQLSLKDLLAIEQGHGLGIITEEKLDSIFPNNKKYFKVVFDESGTPQISALDNKNIWSSSNGLDQSKPVILINPGNGPANAMTQATDLENFEAGLAYEAKLFKKGNRNPNTQFLVAINERMGSGNFNLIKSHNKSESPETYTTERARKQVEAIYGPLIQKGGVKLSDKEIVENLSKMKSFNCSFGTVTANCQENALYQYMKGLDIGEDVIKTAMHSMQRLDLANVALHTATDFPTSTRVVIQGSNDKLAQNHNANQNLRANGSTRVGEYILILSPENPGEVYSPWKKLSEDDKKRDKLIHKGYTKIKDKIGGSWRDALIAKAKGMCAEANLKKDLESQGLDGARYKEPNTHNPPHYTMEATPGNEVSGRDPQNIYKAMSVLANSTNPQKFLESTQKIFQQGEASLASQSEEINKNCKEIDAKAKKEPQKSIEKARGIGIADRELSGR